LSLYTVANVNKLNLKTEGKPKCLVCLVTCL